MSGRKQFIIVGVIILLLIAAAAAIYVAGSFPEGDKEMTYTSITMQEAKEIFETPGDYIILDVRRADEFAEGHIPGAINVANEDIADREPAELPDKEQTIYVYCRSEGTEQENWNERKKIAGGKNHGLHFKGQGF